MPDWTPRFGSGQNLTANQIGREAGPLFQPFVQPVEANPRLRFQTNPVATAKGRPYADVGKMSLNLGSVGETAKAGEQAGGVIQGFGAGAGRFLGGIIGQGQAGADIGEFIGGLGQMPLDIAGNALGAIPAIPLMGGVGPATGMPGGHSVFDLPFMSEEERGAVLNGWDGNPMSLARQVSDWNKQDWAKKIEAGQISPLWKDMAPAGSLGDQVMELLGVFNLPSRALERTLAGGPLDAVSRVNNTPDEHLNPEIVKLKQAYADGTISKDRFLDELVMANAGYSNDWGLNLLGSMVLDPLLLGGEVAAIAGKAALVAKLEKATKFTSMIGKEATSALSKGLEETALRAGKPVAEITGPEIMAEAERLGLHPDALAEARKQLTGRQQFLTDNAFLEPAFKVANSIAQGPLPAAIGMIGRRGSKPVVSAWLTSQATRGAAEYFGRGNWRVAQTELARLGKQDIFDEGMGYATAQVGMSMQQDLLGKDVVAMRGSVMARPTDVALSRLRIGTQQYYRQIEAHLHKVAVDLTLPTGLQTAEQAMARAQDNAVQQLVNMAGISGAEARAIVNKMDAKGLSMIDMAHYGHRIKVFNAAKRADQEALAAAATAAGPASKGGGVLDRVTLIGPRELTAKRAADLQTSLDTLGTHEAAEAGRAAIRQFDLLAEHQLADGPTDEEIVSSLRAWLNDHGDSLTKELTGEESAALTPELTRTLDEGDGYIYGLRPEDGAEWRIRTDPDDPSKIVSSRPWVDIVGDMAQPWSNRFNGDSGVSSMLNALDQVTGTLSHQITTDRITAEARRAFIEKGMNGYAPSQKTALTYGTARELWDGVRSKAVDLGTTPRGMKLEEFKDVIDKIPAAKAAGLSERDLMGMTLSSMEGRVGTVGVTQKLTGSLKTKTMNVPFLPANTVGQMAERMYPMVRFSMNPFFQLQEWVEPWVFMAARGKMARLSTGWIDPLTGKHVPADELMRVQQNLIDRYAAIDPTAQFDQMERSLAYVYASKAAKDVSATADIGRIEAARGMLRGIGTTGDRKKVAQSEMFRHFLGPTLKGYFNAIDPGKWAELEATYGTRDMGQIAVRWLSETDAWANIEPRAANVRLQATKARYIGKTAPVELDGMAQHSFGTTRPAMTIMARDGTLTHDVFNATLREAGADESYIARSWKALQFDVKTGGVDSFWKQMTEGAGARPQIEVDMARALVLAQADAHGISEVEYLSRHLNGHVSTVVQDDLIAGLSGDYAGWDALFQQSKYALDNWFSSDPETGAIIHQRLDPAEAERRFLSQSTEPPSSMPVEQHGAYNDMQKVPFGTDRVNADGTTSYARSLYIPGGMAALDDLEKPFTVWESHLIRNQLVDPNELLDPKLKHALYEKMWRGHQFDMTDGENVFRVYNNTVMAMLSAGLNLTRNELVSTRFRVGSMDELRGLAADVGGLRDTIKATLPKGTEVKANDLGLAYSTRSDVAHYLPLDSVESLEKDAYLPAARTTIHATARLGRGYLDGADRALHAKTMRAYAQREAVRTMEARTQKALDDAQAVLDKAVASGDQEAVAAAEATVAERRLARESIDPDQALADIEARDQAAMDDMDEEAMAAMDRRDEKAIGRINEWAVDLAAEAINKTGLDLRGVLPSEFNVRSVADMTEADQMRFYGAAKALAANPEDLAARDIIRELVPGAKGVDNNLIWKPWNVNGAGLPHAVAPDGRVVGHADADIFGYVKNNDVAWRGFSTNAGMGNALMMAEDMVAHPEHFAQRAGEGLDMFAERMSHRTRGLSLKTGFFGVDLGDPINFERGVMDTHMVGGLTEWLYHDVTKGGTTQEWTDFMASLSPGKQKQIKAWIDRKFTRVDEEIDGVKTGKKKDVPYPQGAPRGAGVYDWSEATGKSVNFKGKIAADADVAQRAGFVRAKISKLPEAERDRLFAMYRNDAELAELYGRNVKIFGGDYQAYENLMTRRKAEEALTDPTLDRHGNGGYQWKLWDDRRMVLDPETSAYAAAHTMPRASVRYMAASDDLHYASGFMDKGGLRSVSDAGYRYLDPVPTMMAQQQGHLLRGATIFGDRTDTVIAITEHANSSTVTHEIAHALLEPNLDVSGKAVVMDDINRVVDEFNTKLVADTEAAHTTLLERAAEATRVEGVHATYQATAKEAGATARTAVATAQKAERDLAKAETALAEKVGALKQLTKDVPARKKAVEGLQPSVKARRLAAIDNDLKRVQDTVDTLTSTRDAIRDTIDPLWDEANTARAAAQSAEQDVSIIAENLRAMRGEVKMAADEYGRLATTPARATKDVWDTEVSEHFADQFNVWLRTGRASNPKLRDTFAYFHRLLSKLEDWVKGNPQVKVSPAMQDLFDRMHTPQVKESVATANAIPFDATQEMFHEAGRHAVIDAADAAHTNVQFRRSRSMFERSLNHPYFGIYPSSYMWGKVAPEMIRALALNPFGIPIPGLVEGAAPGLGFVNAQRAWQAVEMQKDTDPKFRSLMNDPQNDKMFRAASMFLPATPWDDPANFPLWSRRLAEWGLESQDRAALGQEPKGFDPFKVGSEVASYAFGPKATLDWLGDVARFSKAPAVTQFSGSGIENLGPQSLVVTAHGMTPLEQVNAEGAANLRKSLGS